MFADFILTLFKDALLEKSKKSVYFFYSADFGTLSIIGIVAAFYGVEGFIALLTIGIYIAYFFSVALKKYAPNETVTEFARNLLQWSFISVPAVIIIVVMPIILFF